MITEMRHSFGFFSHLHIKQSRSISRPFLDDAHIFKHGLVLRHALQPGPFLKNAGSCCRCLLLHPHLQHLLLLHLQQQQISTDLSVNGNISNLILYY